MSEGTKKQITNQEVDEKAFQPQPTNGTRHLRNGFGEIRFAI